MRIMTNRSTNSAFYFLIVKTLNHM